MSNKHIKQCPTSLVIQEIKLKTTTRYHYISFRMPNIEDRQYTKCCEDVGTHNGITTLETVCGFLKRRQFLKRGRGCQSSPQIATPQCSLSNYWKWQEAWSEDYILQPPLLLSMGPNFCQSNKSRNYWMGIPRKFFKSLHSVEI